LSPSQQSAALAFLAALADLVSEAEAALLAPREEEQPHVQQPAPPQPIIPLQNETAADFVARGGTPGPIPGESIFVGWAVPAVDDAG
jgi:hypothetical protein